MKIAETFPNVKRFDTGLWYVHFKVHDFSAQIASDGRFLGSGFNTGISWEQGTYYNSERIPTQLSEIIPIWCSQEKLVDCAISWNKQDTF